MSRLKAITEQRRQKLTKIRKIGINPYPNFYRRTHTTQEVIKLLDNLEKSESKEALVSVAGRLIAHRRMGQISFMDILDGSGKIQLMADKSLLDELQQELIRELDTGDIIAQTQIPVEPFDTGKSLYEKLEVESLKLFKKTWPKIKSGNFERKKQPEQGGTFHYVNEIERIDEIFLEKRYTANELINILRARTFSPYPGAFIQHKRQKIFLKLEMIPEKAPEGELD